MNDESREYQFVDTNILVYAHDTSAGDKHHAAKNILQDLWASRRGCLSIQVLQEFFIIVTRKIPRPLSGETTKQIIVDLAFWRIHSPDVSDILEAIGIHNEYHISFWDAMIIQSAIRLGSRRIWSEDLNPGQTYRGVQVVNPFLE